MNLSDGRVRVVAEGRRDAIEGLVRALEQGPRMARVQRVGVEWKKASGTFGGFGIRYHGRDT
jgi:acylphosphatase